MIRTIAHLLLILVLLTCPVQCVISGDSCCASQVTESEAGTAQTCPSSDHCCQHAASKDVCLDATHEAPTHIPRSGDDCPCDCLCKGAISSSSQIAEDPGTALLYSVADSGTAYFDVFRHTGTPQADLPDTLSGREIRTLRMSFQV